MKQLLEFQISHRTPRNPPKMSLLKLTKALRKQSKIEGNRLDHSSVLKGLEDQISTARGHLRGAWEAVSSSLPQIWQDMLKSILRYPSF